MSLTATPCAPLGKYVEKLTPCEGRLCSDTCFFYRPIPPPRHLPLECNTSTYIYPTNFPKREYQYEIVKSCFTQNTLVALPTGLGKTFIAGTVLLNCELAPEPESLRPRLIHCMLSLPKFIDGQCRTWIWFSLPILNYLLQVSGWQTGISNADKTSGQSTT